MVDEQTVERARLSASRNSPMADTLDMCVRYMNGEAAEETIPKLVNVIQHGVGLPTRCGGAKFVSQLCLIQQDVPAVLRKHSSRLLRALCSAFSDRR